MLNKGRDTIMSETFELLKIISVHGTSTRDKGGWHMGGMMEGGGAVGKRSGSSRGKSLWLKSRGRVSKANTGKKVRSVGGV